MNNALSLQENFNVAVVALLVGALLFTMHRFCFIMKQRRGKRFVTFHGIHHDDPQDPTRLVFPILPAFYL